MPPAGNSPGLLPKNVTYYRARNRSSHLKTPFLGSIMQGTEKNRTEFAHLFEFKAVERRKLLLSLSITISAMIFEVIGGVMTNSIALLSDAGHMFTYGFAIGVSLVAIFIARKPACHHKTFGLYRAEVLAAFVNGLLLIPIVGFMVFEAISRILNPQPIMGVEMFLVALIGLGVNIASIFILHGSHSTDLNVKSVFYHMIADAASSMGIVGAAILIQITKWIILDPLVSIGISLVILVWAWNILRDSTRILLEMAPRALNVDIINDDLKARFHEIGRTYNSHLWTITPSLLVYSTHVQATSVSGDLIPEITKYLFAKYNIVEATIQLAGALEDRACNNPFQ